MVATAQYFCYVEPSRLSLVGNNSVSLAIPLSSDLTSDLEVVDREKFIKYIEQFLQANTVPVGSVTFLLAPEQLFEQDLSVAQKDIDILAQKFIDTVPFETIASKRISVGGKLRLVTANQDIIDVLKKAFEKKGFIVVAFVPYTIIQATVPELVQSIEPNIIFSKLDSFRQYNLIVDIIRPTTFEKKTGLKGRRDMILLGVFGVLMAVLLILVMSTYVFAPKPKIVLPPGPIPTRALVFPTQKVSSQSSQQIGPTISVNQGSSRVVTP